MRTLRSPRKRKRSRTSELCTIDLLSEDHARYELFCVRISTHTGQVIRPVCVQVHEKRGVLIESPQHFAQLRKLLYRQLLMQGTVISQAGALTAPLTAAVLSRVGTTGSAGDLWSQLVARLGWLFRATGALGTEPGGLLHFIRSRLLPESVGISRRGRANDYLEMQLQKRERLAVRLFVQVGDAVRVLRCRGVACVQNQLQG